VSYKIVDLIAKSSMPSTLKRVLIAYTTYANRDGTSIRPTEAAVAERASASRSTVSRRTQTLIASGLLVHDLDEKGYWLKHAYGENGVWAYVYHIDISKLSDPALIAQWEKEREDHVAKCRKAGAKNFASRWARGTSGNPSGLSKIQQQEQRDLRQTLAEGFATNPPEQNALVGAEGFATRTLPGNPRSADQSDNPSAVSTAVKAKARKKERKKVSPSAISASPTSSNLEPEDQQQKQKPSGDGLSPDQMMQADDQGEESSVVEGRATPMATPDKSPHAADPPDEHQPQTVEELMDNHFSDPATELLYRITPNVTDAMVLSQYPICVRILSFFYVRDEFKVFAAMLVLNFNRAHRSGKYASKEDKLMYLRDAPQFLRALESPTAKLMNDYDQHDYENCDKCAAADGCGGMHYRKLIREMLQRRADRDAEYKRKVEEEAAKKRDANASAPIQFDRDPFSKEEQTDLARWFKESGKVGEWQLTKEDWSRLGVNNINAGFVLRYLRQNGMAVTQQQFEELLKESAQKKSMAAASNDVASYDVL
jgi:hypothetical protein